jgi:FkbM family methyltransferase
MLVTTNHQERIMSEAAGSATDPHRVDAEAIRSDPIFNALVGAFDTLFRVYMRVLSLRRLPRYAPTVFGATIKCDIKDFIQRRICFFHVYEPNLTYFLLNKLQRGECFVDIGANIGYFSLLASSRVGGSGKVIAVEAAPETFRLLQDNIERNHCTNVAAYNLAATADDCRVRIVRTDARNIGANTITPGTADDEASVQGASIVKILGADIGRVNVIKIDIEGSEAPVLKDIIENLDKFPARLTIITELGPQSAQAAAELCQAGFKLYALPNDYSIGHLLVRGYLAKSHEHEFSVTRPVARISTDYRDYIFER